MDTLATTTLNGLDFLLIGVTVLIVVVISRFIPWR